MYYEQFVLGLLIVPIIIATAAILIGPSKSIRYGKGERDESRN